MLYLHAGQQAAQDSRTRQGGPQRCSGAVSVKGDAAGVSWGCGQVHSDCCQRQRQQGSAPACSCHLLCCKPEGWLLIAQLCEGAMAICVPLSHYLRNVLLAMSHMLGPAEGCYGWQCPGPLRALCSAGIPWAPGPPNWLVDAPSLSAVIIIWMVQMMRSCS